MKKSEKDLKETLEFNVENWQHINLPDYMDAVIKSNLVIIDLLKDIKKELEK